MSSLVVVKCHRVDKGDGSRERRMKYSGTKATSLRSGSIHTQKKVLSERLYTRQDSVTL